MLAYKLQKTNLIVIQICENINVIKYEQIYLIAFINIY